MQPGRRRDRLAVLAAITTPLIVTVVLVPWRTSFANTNAALVLVAVIVAVAANGNRLAGVLAAVSAAVWFDFFLTQPYEHFSITRRTDVETTVLLLGIGVAVTELAVWGRRQHTAASRRAGYLSGIHATAKAVAVGDSSPAVIAQVTDQLSRLLRLRSCHFQRGVAGIGDPPRLHHDGRITLRTQVGEIDSQDLPADRETELLAESSGYLRGRFLMLPTPGAPPTLEERLIAGALADQVGAALTRDDLARH